MLQEVTKICISKIYICKNTINNSQTIDFSITVQIHTELKILDYLPNSEPESQILSGAATLLSAHNFWQCSL